MFVSKRLYSRVLALTLLAWLCLALPARAQIAFVNSSQNQVTGPTGATTFPLNVPVGEADGDGMLACVTWRNVSTLSTITPPIGGAWTLLQTQGQTSCSNKIQMACYSRLASSEPASYPWTFSGGSESPQISGFILDYRGILTSGMVDVSAINSGSATPGVAPSITTAAPNEQVVSAFSTLGAIAGGPAGETQRANIPPLGTLQPYNPGMLGADTKMTVAGPSGAKSVPLTFLGFSNPCWVAANIALVPSPSPPPPPIQNVTVTGTIDNFYGKPCVACHVDLYALNPTVINGSGSGGTLIETNPVRVETNRAGVFSASVVGGVTAALFVEETSALMKATLPASGTITLAQIMAAQPNVVSAFPPTGNLNMGGNHFVNMSGGAAVGDSAAVGAGLGAGAQIFITSGTYAFPTGATFAEALLIGGGGGGGGGNSGASNGGGGGGAGANETCLLYPLNGPVTLTVGGGGTGGAATATGTIGQDTVVAQGIATCTAPHGTGGVGGSGGGPGNGGAASSGGSITGAARQLYTTAGVAGSNGSAGGGGAGGAAGVGSGGGGAGGAPSGGLGVVGQTGQIIIWAY